MGLSQEGFETIASIIRQIAREGADPELAAPQVQEVRESMSPRYCYGPDMLEAKLGVLLRQNGDAEPLPRPLREFLYS
jgi:hypothetical protein